MEQELKVFSEELSQEGMKLHCEEQSELYKLNP